MIGFGDPHDHANRARFARPIAPEESIDLAFVNIQAKLIYGTNAAVTQCQIVRPKQTASGFFVSNQGFFAHAGPIKSFYQLQRTRIERSAHIHYRWSDSTLSDPASGQLMAVRLDTSALFDSFWCLPYTFCPANAVSASKQISSV